MAENRQYDHEYKVQAMKLALKKSNNLVGEKNNNSHSEKWVIVKFYTIRYRNCGNFN